MSKERDRAAPVEGRLYFPFRFWFLTWSVSNKKPLGFIFFEVQLMLPCLSDDRMGENTIGIIYWIEKRSSRKTGRYKTRWGRRSGPGPGR